MKRIILLVLIAFFSFGFILNMIAERNVQQILKQLSVNDETAKEYIWSNCSGKMFYFPSPGELKSAAMGERASIVNAIGNYAKEYSKTQEFLEKYKEYKESMKPQPPSPPQSGDSMKEQQRAAYIQSIDQMEKIKKSMPADQQATFDESIKTMKEQLKELEDPANDESYQQMDVIMKQGYEEQQKQYQAELIKWEQEYPDNPKLMIKAWLNEFLESTKDVDYNAELKTNSYGQKVFVNPDYERKDYLWKLCFRSGKETLEAGRAFANEWLKEISN